jgi:precorrin-2 methylase
LVEEATIDSLPAAMARADRALEELETLRAASWSAPADHPELNPELSIRVLSETLDELRKQTDSHDKLIAEKMSRASRSISRLSAALKASDKQLATNRLAAVKASCVDCHEQYRNR